MGFKNRTAHHATEQSSLWSVPVYLPYLQPKLTGPAVREVEKALGVKLPESYLALLREQNGGYVRRTLPETVHSVISGIGPHFPSIGDKWYADIEGQEDVWLPSEPRSLVAFDGDGHWYLVLDYRSSGPQGEPAVSYIDLDCEVDRRVAKTYAAFLGMLEEDVDEDTLGLTEVSLKEAVERLEFVLKTKFERPDSGAHGYPEYRARLRKKKPEWLWVSPNEVPRGFVRKGDARYKEVVGLLPGTALRFPHFPDVQVIVSCTDGIASKVKAGCDRAGFQVVSLSAHD